MLAITRQSLTHTFGKLILGGCYKGAGQCDEPRSRADDVKLTTGRCVLAADLGDAHFDVKIRCFEVLRVFRFEVRR